MKEYLYKIEAILGRCEPPAPVLEDFKNKADYFLARTLHKRFPKRFNEPSKKSVPQKELCELWRWANGENGIGKLKPEYRFLPMEESENTRKNLYLSANMEVLKDMHPIFWYLTNITFAIRR